MAVSMLAPKKIAKWLPKAMITGKITSPTTIT